MEAPHGMTVLFFVRRVGPYHHVRFEAACTLVNLIVVETRAESAEYAWQFSARGKYTTEKFPTDSSIRESGLRGIALANAITTLLDRYRPNVVVTTGWADPEYHTVVIESAQRKIPLVTVSDSRYEDEPRSFAKELIKKIVLRSYSAVIVAGTSAAAYAIRLGMAPASVFRPWDVVDNTYFESSITQRSAFDTRSFLCISRLIEKKNLAALIDAFAGYRNNGGKRALTILGNGELEDALKQKVAQLGLNEFVHFHGFVQYEGLPKFMSNAIGLVLASTTDQWGLAVNEGMAAGLPVLVSENCGCAVDLVENNVNGYVFDPFDKNSITNAFEKLDRIDELSWNRMSKLSRDVVNARWKPSDFGAALLNAANYSVQKRSSVSLLFLHRLLSRL